MPKFSGRATPTPRVGRTTSPVRTTGTTLTHEGAVGFGRDLRSEFFLLAVTNMVGEDTFYESAEDRDARFAELVHKLTVDDPEFVAKVIPWLRNTANMRSAPLVAAAEYVAARGTKGRKVIDSAIVRADEPAELLGYWLTVHGRKIPQPVKRGLADAVQRLYNERNLLKYDGQSRSVRFGDVIELAHPSPNADWQSDLFRYAIERRHNRDEPAPASLTKIVADEQLQALPEPERWDAIDRALEADWPWERLFGWLPGLGEKGAKAKAWQAVIPRLGYMALLRNLRNIEEADVDQPVIDAVNGRLTDPEQVARSRQFPYRFLSAYKATGSLTFAPALERALDLAVSNIPALDEDTLVLIDVSGSMDATLSARSQVRRWEAGALFGLALAKRTERVKVVLFGTDNAELKVRPKASVLRGLDDVSKIVRSGKLGWGTNAYPALATHYDSQKRVVIFTDEQVHPSSTATRKIADKVPVLYTFNLGGYRPAGFEAGKPGRHTLGGFSDATFKLMELIERYESAGWDALLGE